MSFFKCILLGGALAVAGCTSMPDAQIQYYLPQAETTITVTQTVDCDATKKRVIFNQSVAAPSTEYSADPNRVVKPITIKGLDGTFADASAGFTFYDDGRLKGINASSTGQGATIIKSAVTLATTLAPLLVKGSGAGVPADNSCTVVQKMGGGKPLTLTYRRTLTKSDFVNAQNGLSIDISAGDATVYNLLKADLPSLSLNVAPTVMAGVVVQPTDTSNAVLVPVTKTTNLGLTVQATLAAKTYDIWSGSVIVPSAGFYEVPVPKPALFGTSNFVLAVNDAGLVTTLTYGKNTGAANALDAANSIATAVKPQSTADEAADVKAQADLIVQQQRLARCKANPASCS